MNQTGRKSETSLSLGQQKETRVIWEFPKIRGTLFCGPYSKDPTILGYYTRVPSPIFGNSHIEAKIATTKYILFIPYDFLLHLTG